MNEAVDSTQPITPPSVTSNTSEEVIVVEPFVIGPTGKHYHSSLSKIIKDHGTGMLTHLEELGEVASLAKAKVVGEMRKAKSTAWEVVYSKMEVRIIINVSICLYCIVSTNLSIILLIHLSHKIIGVSRA